MISAATIRWHGVAVLPALMVIGLFWETWVSWRKLRHGFAIRVSDKGLMLHHKLRQIFMDWKQIDSVDGKTGPLKSEIWITRAGGGLVKIKNVERDDAAELVRHWNSRVFD